MPSQGSPSPGRSCIPAISCDGRMRQARRGHNLQSGERLPLLVCVTRPWRPHIMSQELRSKRSSSDPRTRIEMGEAALGRASWGLCGLGGSLLVGKRSHNNSLQLKAGKGQQCGPPPRHRSRGFPLWFVFLSPGAPTAFMHADMGVVWPFSAKWHRGRGNSGSLTRLAPSALSPVRPRPRVIMSKGPPALPPYLLHVSVMLSESWLVPPGLQNPYRSSRHQPTNPVAQ